MTVQETSRIAYRQIQPRLGMKQAKVLKVLRAARDTRLDFTNCELALVLDWPINTICPRVYELRKLGLVVLSRKRACERTGRLAMAWQAKEGFK